MIKAASQTGANIAVITDYDLSGINLASKTDPSVYYITMDATTLQYFGLREDDKRIVIDATNKGKINIVRGIISKDSRFAHLDPDFLETRRIEINAVIAQVGDERFWNFIMDKVGKQFPTRNYNRAIETPSKDKDADPIDLYPKGMKSLIKYYRDKVDDIVKDTEGKIQKEQEKVEGFLEVAEQKKKNKEQVKKVIADNEEIKDIETNVLGLCEKLDIEVSDDDSNNNSSSGSDGDNT